MTDFSTARKNMIDGQLRPNKVSDSEVLTRFAEVPRELFMPPEKQSQAYTDQLITLGQNRCIATPLVTARLIQALNVTSEDTLLVVAMGTGYSTALLAGLTDHITAIESDLKYISQARNALLDLDITHVDVIHAAPELGYETKAPYTKIFVEAPMGHIPPALIQQLSANGTMAGVLQGDDGLMEATTFAKIGKTLITKPLFETKGTILPNFATNEVFTF